MEVDAVIRAKELIEQKTRYLMSEEAKRLDSLFKDVMQVSSSVAMNLVTTRQKLQPFVCEGVVYKDRKKRKDENAVLEIIGGSKMLMLRINTRIAEYRR